MAVTAKGLSLLYGGFALDIPALKSSGFCNTSGMEPALPAGRYGTAIAILRRVVGGSKKPPAVLFLLFFRLSPEDQSAVAKGDVLVSFIDTIGILRMGDCQLDKIKAMIPGFMI
jgi:hypothetical protein